MKLRIVLATVACVGVGAVYFSCGSLRHKSTSSSSDTTVTTASSPTVVNKPFTLAISGSTVDVPANAIKTGSKLTASASTTPEKFNEASVGTSASGAVAVTAVDQSGAALKQVAQPLTIELDITNSTALVDVPKTQDNLCVFGLGQDNEFRVWRKTSLTVQNAGKSLSFASDWLGQFQVFYCGGEPIAGALDVNAQGTDATTPAGPPGSAYGTCDLTKVVNVNQCWSYVGKNYAQADALAATKTSCISNQGSFSSDSCPSGNAYGACVSYYGTTAEFAYVYYIATGAAATAGAALQTACEQTATNKWFAPGKYVPSAVSQQTEAK